MTLALVPVKRLADTKSRLLPQLAPEARETFALAMLADVIAALLGAESVGRTVVLTPAVPCWARSTTNVASWPIRPRPSPTTGSASRRSRC